MKKIFLFIFIFLFFIIFSYENIDFSREKSNEFLKNKIIETKVIRVIDGDTVILDFNNKNKKVRLVGMNSPESKNVNGSIKECLGTEATEMAKNLLKNEIKVIFEYNENNFLDKYGRVLGYLFLKDQEGNYTINFAQKMIRSGYAYEYTYKGKRYKYQKEFKSAQKKAKEDKNGLWSDDLDCSVYKR